MMAPDYYPEFCCIADRCKHSCCKGWEIDIDPDTLKMYQQMQGEWGEKLRSQIDICEETASFHLRDDESCPFLNESGLCDLILEFGEEVLCQICTDHPRFYHEYADRTEVGLGLCCEEAARLILCRQEPVRMIALTDDGETFEPDQAEQSFFVWREMLLEQLQNRKYSFEERIEKLCRREHLPSITNAYMMDSIPFLLELEQMDEAWGRKLENVPPSELNGWDTGFEQFMCYLLIRHLKPHGQNRITLLFCLFACKLVQLLFSSHQTAENLIEIARLFSSEIEYSDENVDLIMEKLQRDFVL